MRSHLDNILGIPTSIRPDPSVRRRILFSNSLTQAEISPDSLDLRLRMFSLMFKLAFEKNFQNQFEIGQGK